MANTQVSPAMNKLAICIGNSDYSAFTKLPSCTKDSNDVAAQLTAIGFQVMQRENLTLSSFEQLLTELMSMYKKNKKTKFDMVLFFYSGHGGVTKSSGGVLQLLPIDAKPDNTTTVVGMDIVENTMATISNAPLYFLDCCRNVLDKGNKPVEQFKISISGAFFAYACEAGKTALTSNNISSNSYFTEVLLKFLKLKGKPVQVRRVIFV